MPRVEQHRVLIGDGGAVAAVSAEVFEPPGDPSGPVLLLAHGAGSRLDHPVHRGVATAVADAGITVVTFNFAYSEAGRRGPDPAARLQSCYRDVAAWAGAAHPGRPLVGGGRSMGGRMASMLAAEGYPFAGLVLLNYPLVGSRGGPGSPPRTAHWPMLRVPVLFVHGTRDALLPDDVFALHRPLLQTPVTVHVVGDADHVFAVPKRAMRSPEDVYAEIGGAIGRWMARLEVLA